MALLAMESFDYFSTADLAKANWTVGSDTLIQPGAGRRGTQSLRLLAQGIGSGVSKLYGTTTGETHALVGMAINYSHTVAFTIVSLRDSVSSINQVLLVQNTNGTLGVYRGSGSSQSAGSTTGATLLGTTVATIAKNVWAYIELRVVFDLVVGEVEVRIDGVSVLSLTGVNTLAVNTVGHAFWNGIALRCSGTSGSTVFDVDDVYVFDGVGAVPTFLGDSRVDVLMPTGDVSTGWTPGGGINWTRVDELPLGVDLVSTGVLNAQDLYVLSPVLPGSPIVHGVGCFSASNLQDLFFGTAGLKYVLVTGGSTFESNQTTFQVVSGFEQTKYRGGFLHATNPLSGLAWTVADVMPISSCRTAGH